MNLNVYWKLFSRVCLWSWMLPLMAQQTLVNPLRQEQTQAPVRLQIPAGHQGRVLLNGEPIPYQWELAAQGPEAWGLVNLSGGQHGRITVDGQTPPAFPATLHLREVGDVLEIINGTLVARLPARAAPGEAPAPLLGIRQREGAWVGGGRWEQAPPLTAYSLRILGRGPVQLTLLQEFEFEGGYRLRNRIRLRPGRDFLEIEERISLPEETRWVFDLAAGEGGWQPHTSLFTRHGGGAGRPINTNVQTGTLAPGQSRMGDVLVFLLPRWSQAMDDGWMAAAADDTQAVGAVAVRAGQWYWAHEGRMAVRLSDSQRQMALEMPGVTRGARMWWLRAAPRDQWETGTLRHLTLLHAMAELDKVNRHYILDGFPEGQTTGFPHPFIGDQVNPTGPWRQQARRDRQQLGGTGNFGDLVWSQAVLDPDYFGTPWYGWSVQNPNFWTDLIQRPLFRFTRLQSHPRFAELQVLSRLAVKADLHHSIVVPGGAGQECPGYHAHAHQVWEQIRESTAEVLGLDESVWERHLLGQEFLIRSSQPDGPNRRRMIPHGDTHPRQGGPPIMDLQGHQPQTWETEEFPGFGVIFRNRPGTARETFLAFKAGPNRGHYHGDQLALHWADQSRPLMVDHHVSFNPRAGQEHMHNRLSFGTAEMPWANMDGHERVLGLVTHPEVDVSVGEVTSRRLRHMPRLPPEEWDQRWNVLPLSGELRYERTVILLKGLDRDAVVLLDRWTGPRPLDVTFNAHVLENDLEFDGNVARAGRRFTAIRLLPEAAEAERFDFSHNNGAPESTVGVRWTTQAASGTFLTVLWPGADPPPVAATATGLTVGPHAIAFGEGGAGSPFVQVSREGRPLVALDSLDFNRSQGDIGIFVPDAGYPFGPIPPWLAEQRLARPPWARQLPGLLDPMERF